MRREDVAAREFLYDPATSLYVDEALLPHDARLEALKRRYEDMKSHLVKDAQKARKCESKIETLTKGYGLKSKAYLKSIGTVLLPQKETLLSNTSYFFDMCSLCRGIVVGHVDSTVKH